MMNKITHIFLLTTALTCNYVTAMELALSKTHLLVIPGQNGMGGQNVDIVLPYFADKGLKYHIKTPLDKPDFGQDECQKLLSNAIEELKETDTIRDWDNIILHMSSQATQTGIIYTAQNPDKKIKALILESIMLTGNSAIFHTVDSTIIPEQSNLPDSSYYALPYTAKSIYPMYSPAGEQAIKNIDQLPTDLLIIILHDPKDFQLSFKDAQGLYAYLTHVRGNQNVYLFAPKSPHGEHINLLKEHNTKEINTINIILKLHNLLPKDSSEMIKNYAQKHREDLNKYQPIVHIEWLDHFYAVLNKEKNLECIDSSIKATTVSAGLYAIGKWFGL